VVDAMKQWGEIALQGREAILAQDFDRLHTLINDNFDLRTTIYKIDKGNLEMIHAARSVGACSHFSGSGGAISGLYKDEAMFERLVEVMKPLGVAVIKPAIV
jgi:glucuronokinase